MRSKKISTDTRKAPFKSVLSNISVVSSIIVASNENICYSTVSLLSLDKSSRFKIKKKKNFVHT